MSKVLTLARRELAAYFFSPMAYVITTLFLAGVGVLFLWGLKIPFLGINHEPVFRNGGEASLRVLFDSLAYGLVIVCPLLTMRSVAEEFRGGTIETLMTAPVTDAQVILGKFLGAMGLYLVLLVTTLVYFGLIVKYGQPDYGVAVTGYLGMILLGAAFISVGLFTSTLTRHQLVAGLVGIAILSFFTAGIYLLAGLVQEHADVVNRLNMISYFSDFSKGVFDTTGLIFFVSVTVFFLFISVKVLESRRWR